MGYLDQVGGRNIRGRIVLSSGGHHITTSAQERALQLTRCCLDGVVEVEVEERDGDDTFE